MQKVVQIKNVSSDVFLSLLEYLYTDLIDIHLDQAMDLFVAADQFGVERLKKLCEKKILVSINTDNAATVLQKVFFFIRFLKKISLYLLFDLINYLLY